MLSRYQSQGAAVDPRLWTLAALVALILPACAGHRQQPAESSETALAFASSPIAVVGGSSTMVALERDKRDDECDDEDDRDDGLDDDSIRLEEVTIATVHAAMLDDELTCVQLAEWYLDRIHRLDQDLADGFPVNSVLWVNENLRTRARELDAALEDSEELVGPLHCVPILLKDNHDTSDMPTTAGSLAMLGAQPPDDAFVVSRLRDAGALMLGKATMDAWAMGAEGESSRPRAGCPYDRAFLTSSSSSGSAASVSANFVLVATGSDTCGSLTSPGSYNGVVAIRSSYGLVSTDGIVPLASSHDVAGPMARTVEDAVRLLNIMAADDSVGPATTAPDAQRYHDYTAFLDVNGAANKRIGVLRSAGSGDSVIITAPTNTRYTKYAAAFNEALATLHALGAELVDPIHFEGYIGHYLTDYEAEVYLNAYLASYDAPLTDISALLQHPRVHPNVATRLATRVIPKFNPDDPRYAPLVADNQETKRRLDALIDAHQLDALVLLGRQGCQVSVTTGIPYMVVPAGFRTGGDPRGVGLGIMARRWDEPTMIAIAYAFEQARGPRVPPEVATSLPRCARLPRLHSANYNACVEEIARTARELQGSDFRNLTPEDYRQYVLQADCTLPTHAAAGVK